MSAEIKVAPKEDGAVISVEGWDIVITIKPTGAPLERLPSTVKPPMVSLESVRSSLNEYLDELEVSEEEGEVVVKPEGYLGRDRFAQIAAVVEELGGRYISAGRESRFVIPKKQ